MKKITVQSKLKTVSQYAREKGISVRAVYNRIEKGELNTIQLPTGGSKTLTLIQE